jgi:hypothetical protein
MISGLAAAKASTTSGSVAAAGADQVEPCRTPAW